MLPAYAGMIPRDVPELSPSFNVLPAYAGMIPRSQGSPSCPAGCSPRMRG